MTTAVFAQFQTLVNAVQPLLATNLAAAYKEWMAGDLPRGAYEHCLSRSTVAAAIAGGEATAVSAGLTGAMRAGALLFIDLKSAMREVAVGDQAIEQAKVEALRVFYGDQGFTETHAWLGIPVLPEAKPALVD